VAALDELAETGVDPSEHPRSRVVANLRGRAGSVEALRLRIEGTVG
jgi:hypothetical protein